MGGEINVLVDEGNESPNLSLDPGDLQTERLGFLCSVYPGRQQGPPASPQRLQHRRRSQDQWSWPPSTISHDQYRHRLPHYPVHTSVKKCTDNDASLHSRSYLEETKYDSPALDTTLSVGVKGRDQWKNPCRNPSSAQKVPECSPIYRVGLLSPYR